MKKTLLFLLFTLIFCLAAAPLTAADLETAANADNGKAEKKLFFLSPSASYFFPSSGKTRDTFGSSWGGVGVALNPEALGWETPRLKTAGITLTPFIGYSYAKEGDNKAYIIPVGVATGWTLKEGKHYRTSIGLGLSANGVRVKVPDEGINSDWKVALGGRVTLAYSLAKWLDLTAGYSLMTDVEGYSFNGFTIGAKVNFYF